MNDSVLIRMNSELKDLIDWYAESMCTNRSTVVRMILHQVLSQKKKISESSDESLIPSAHSPGCEMVF